MESTVYILYCSVVKILKALLTTLILIFYKSNVSYNVYVLYIFYISRISKRTLMGFKKKKEFPPQLKRPSADYIHRTEHNNFRNPSIFIFIFIIFKPSTNYPILPYILQPKIYYTKYETHNIYKFKSGDMWHVTVIPSASASALKSKKTEIHLYRWTGLDIGIVQKNQKSFPHDTGNWKKNQ